MFNTLKEMQETIPYEDLCKYTYESVGKSAEEIKELLKSHDIEVTDSVAKECYDFMKDIDVMTDDELMMISGGERNGPKQIIKTARMTLTAGRETLAPPVGPVLKYLGINGSDFLNEFNARTKTYEGKRVHTKIDVYVDYSFSFIVESPRPSKEILPPLPL